LTNPTERDVVMATQEFTVSGLHCGGCAAKVTKAVDQLTGLTVIDLDVASGRLQVDAERVDALADVRADVQAAVEHAGYVLV
jgi:copper chaperone CopZ